MIVVRIENLDKIACQIFFLDCLIIFPFVKGIQTKDFLWLCIPNHQGVDHIVVVADDRHIIRNCDHRRISLVDKVQVAVLALLGSDIASKTDFMCIFRSLDLKRITVL